MKFSYLATLIIALSISTAALAASKEEELFLKGNCNNCHTHSADTVGPTRIAIADKYRGDPNAQEKLEQKVRVGGSGSWGVMPMPGTRSSITDAEISILVKWILESKPLPEKSEKKAK